MKIAFETTAIHSGHKVRGSGFYVANLKDALLKYVPEHSYVFFNQGDKLVGDIDLVHYTSFDVFFKTIPFIKRHPSVVTVHDLIPIMFPKHFPAGVRGRIKWSINKQVLKNATNAIITDSDSSKNDIVKQLKISNKKVNTIPLASADHFKQILNGDKLLKKYNLPERFVLYVGDSTWNKNLPNIARSIIKADFPLVIVGKVFKTTLNYNSWNKDFHEFEKLTAESKLFIKLGFVDSHELIALYNQATALLMPSLYEGFGLPVLEAMSCGCPVITSKCGSLPEVAGDAAIFVDPKNVDEIAKEIRNVVNNQDLRKKLTMKGLKNAKKFSWEKTAHETIKVYLDAIS